MSSRFYDEGEPASGRKVMLAIPTYDRPDTSLTFSLARSREALHAAGVGTALFILEGNCHVDDARNAIVAAFMESDCTELLFLDADVTWPIDAIVSLCGRDKAIVGGVYPFRKEGVETMPVRLAGAKPGRDGLCEVEGLPTGFMKIKRHVFEEMDVPVFNTKEGPRRLYFDRPAPGKDGVRWGGDIAFCNRWRAMGGKIWADAELRLGHVAKVILHDSLGAWLRRADGATLKHVTNVIKRGEEGEAELAELFKFAGNNFAADPAVLAAVAAAARQCTGPIIETGSGLSTLVAAAASGQDVHALEHLPFYANQTDGWAGEAGLSNVHIHCGPLGDDLWYQMERFDLPERFSLGICDGPPRVFGSRMEFFRRIAPRCTMLIIDDMDTDTKYSAAVEAWAAENERRFEGFGRVAIIHPKESVPA